MSEVTAHRPETTYGLQISTVQQEGELLVGLAGRLDARTADLLLGCCRSWAVAGLPAVVVDVGALTALDGWGVAALVRSRRVLRAHGASMRVSGAPEEARRLLSRTGLYDGRTRVAG
jgi:anti-anti-sigma factor